MPIAQYLPSSPTSSLGRSPLDDHHLDENRNPTSPGENPSKKPFLPQAHSQKDSQSPSRTRPSLIRRWFARSVDLQPSGNFEETDSDGPPISSWGIHWYTPVSMIFLFFLGVGSAVGHHIYYTSLDASQAGDASSQEWVIRFGTALAFLCRAALAATVAISRKQWVWVTMRRRFMTLAGIDAMFGVTSDPFFFLNRDMLQGARVSTLMALFIWILPLTAIFTPSTISVALNISKTSTPCTVRTVLFDYEEDSKAVGICCRDPTKFFSEVADIIDDSYVQPTSFARSIFSIPAFSGHITAPKNVGLYDGDKSRSPTMPEGITLAQDCGRNCTYNLTFLAPAVNCTEKTPWNETDAPWDNPNQFLNKTLYRAERPQGSMGALWIGYVSPVPSWANSGPFGEVNPHVYVCKNSVANYSVKLEVQDYTFREPTIETVDIIYTINDTSTFESYGEPGFFYDPTFFSDKYRKVTYAAAHRPNLAFFDTLVSILSGNITMVIMPNTRSYFASQTQIGGTPLSSSKFTIEPSLGTAIEAMAQKMVVSLLSADGAGIEERDPLMEYAALIRTNCTSTKYYNVYQYVAKRLVLAYAMAATITFLMLVLGFVALESNGVASDASFSTMLLTTRNPTLDRLTAGGCLGGDPVPEELRKLKLAFGKLKTEGGPGPDEVGHLAIGIEGEIVQIVKGGRYS